MPATAVPLDQEGLSVRERCSPDEGAESAELAECDCEAGDVADDGDGFDPGARSDGFGLVSMQERAKALGGRFRLASTPGTGTEIEIVIP